jgi:hypothetical protein
MASSLIRDHGECEKRQVVKLRILLLQDVARKGDVVGVLSVASRWSEVLRLHDGLGFGRFCFPNCDPYR